jgi:anti-sigma factor RsiW
MKPECSEYQAKIGRFLLGDLTQKEREAIEEHLASCPQCQSEQESYTRTLNLVQSVDNEPVPRHFFIQPEERALNLWELFRMLKPRWQAITAGLFLLAGIGGVMGFTRGSIDATALKRDFLKAAEEQNRRTAESFLQEVRAEIAQSHTDLTQQQKAELTAALDRVDSRMAGRLKLAEGSARDEARKMAADVYQTISRQRVQDLNLINLRFDGIEASSTLETRQTDAILNTLLQVAELKLK